MISILNNPNIVYEYSKDSLEKFEFENGKILENVEVEYVVKGAPKYDKDGNIENMVIFCHNYDGSSFSIDGFSQLTAEGKPFDFNEYFFVSITSLGVPGSCSPSSTNLRYNFPKYSFKDKVNFKRQFIKEKFGSNQVLGIVGRGLGGYEAYTWACEYSEDMEFIIVLSSSFKTNGYRYVVARGIESVIEASDNFYSDVYNESLSKTMVSINKILYSNYFSRRIFQGMSNDEIDVLMDEYVDDGLFIDIYDFKFQNDSILGYDVEDKLSDIQAKTLVISPTDDLYFSPEFDTLPLKELINDCELYLFDLHIDNLNNIDYAKFIETLSPFLEQFKK